MPYIAEIYQSGQWEPLTGEEHSLEHSAMQQIEQIEAEYHYHQQTPPPMRVEWRDEKEESE